MKGGLHGLAGGEAAPSADWTIPQDWDRYTNAEHALWGELYSRQIAAIEGRACQAFLDGLKALPIGPHEIPRFDELNQTLKATTGWEVVAVPGLVPDDVFFEHLANRRFPSGQFLRKPHERDYLQEPDIFHDVFGHVPMLMNPIVADFICDYGKGGLRALSLGVLDNLARLYWYTIEFGLVMEAGQMRIFGAGILSSFGETKYALESQKPLRIGFDMARVMRTLYRIDDFQEVYFVLDSFERLLGFSKIDFAPIYEALKQQSPLKPRETVPEDRFI